MKTNARLTRPRALVDVQRARRALAVTFLIYVLQAALAAMASLPSAAQLRRLLPGSLARDIDVALSLDALGELGAIGRVLRMELGLSLLMMALLGAWLQMAWYAAMRRELALSTALVDGAQRAGRALGVSALITLLVAALALPFAGAAYWMHRELEGGGDARAHDLAVLGALVPLLPIALYGGVLHDLARAEALSRGALASVRRALLPALRPRVLALALALGLGGGALICAGQLAAAALPGGFTALALGPLLLQLSLLGRLWLRSLWLTCALAQSEPGAAAEVREHESVRTD